MGSFTIIFLICSASLLGALSSAYRMDKFLKPLKVFHRIDLPAKLKTFFLFSNKEKRTDFLLYSIIISCFIYFAAITALILFISALIVWNGDYTFAAAVIQFCYMALSVLILCFEMVMLTFFDKKTFGEE